MPDEVHQGTLDLPEDLRAIFVDANVMSRGRLKVHVLRDLVEVIESQELDVAVLIPAPVIWEWAEHLAAALAGAQFTYTAAMEQAAEALAENALQPPWENVVSNDEIAEELLTVLADVRGVKVLDLDSQSHLAVEAIRDQVLVLGAARIKSGVKTGSADSASFRLARAEHARLGGTLLVVSGDQDARRYFAEMPSVVISNSLSRARAGIVAMRKGSHIAADRLRSTIQQRLPHMTMDEFGLPTVERSGVIPGESPLGGLRIAHLQYELAAVESVQSVSYVEVSKSEGYATAVVEAAVRVERDLQVLNERTGLIEMDVDSFAELNATLEVSAESKDGTDWNFVVDRVLLK